MVDTQSGLHGQPAVLPVEEELLKGQETAPTQRHSMVVRTAQWTDQKL